MGESFKKKSHLNFWWFLNIKNIISLRVKVTYIKLKNHVSSKAQIEKSILFIKLQ